MYVCMYIALVSAPYVVDAKPKFSCQIRGDGNIIKGIIMKEYQITTGICRRGFVECVKYKTESVVQYVSRLRSLLQCYLDSRKATTFPDLMDLMIVDHVKDSLTQEEKYYVGEKEADGCLKSTEIAKLIDVYQAIRLEERGKVKPRHDYKQSNKQQNKPYAEGKDADL